MKKEKWILQGNFIFVNLFKCKLHNLEKPAIRFSVVLAPKIGAPERNYYILNGQTAVEFHLLNQEVQGRNIYTRLKGSPQPRLKD